tara:strand:- start:4018 stop:8031 length:4014 start_codon:yes stop_codon:yes gene_type:complete
MAVNNLIKLRRGSATDWSSDPVLAQGEPGFDTTNNILKIGDGTTAWSSLVAVNNTDHPTISAASSSDNSGNTFIQDLTLDSNGHVTAIAVATASEGGGGGIGNIVEDTTPQLGGNLDLNSQDITGTGDIDITGSGHFSGKVEADSFVKDGGTSSQFLKADGSVDSNTYITSVEDDGSPVLGGSLTLDQHDINVQVKNDSGSSISAGTPVYIAGYHAGSSKPLIAPANASSTSTMPAFGIVENTIADGAEGVVAIMGIVAGIDTTSPISFSANDIVYVKAGGGLTNVKPTGVSEQIQNLGKVTKVHATNGRILLLGAGRSNDIPNSGTFNGNVQAASFIKSGGTSSEFLKADGSVDTNTYLTAHPSISAASSSDNSGRTYIQDIGLDSNGHVISITTATETVTDTNTQLTEEQVEDFVGGMVTGNTETGITVTYDDSDGTLDFVVASQTDENFTTADHSKLDGIEAGADVTDTTNVTAAGALMDSEVTNLAQVKAFDSSDYATAAQGTKADSAQQPPAEGAFVDGDKTKLDGIETGATADQTDEEIQDIVGAMLTGNTETGITVTYQDADGTIDFAVASQTDENFTTADHSKLDGIEANADVTDTANVTAAGALMDSELTDLAGVKGVTISTLQVKPSEGAFANGDKTKLDGIEASADVTDATNVDAAGAVMNSDSSTASMSFVVDEDNMASDSATKVPTQQSVKAYVDANAGGGGSMTTVKGDGSQVGGADIVTLDFSDKFTVAESPDTEINIGLSTEVLSSGDLSTTLSGTTGIHIAYDSSADAIGINVDPTLISSRTEVTSADADYLLVWDATDSELKKVDAGEFRGGGGGSMTTVKGDGSQVGGADIVTLDFSSEFAVTESPDTEINISLSSEILSSGDLSTTLSGSAGISLAYDSNADAIGINVDINGSTDLTAPAVGDELIISDASDSNNIKKADVASVVNLADHDALTNFVANEHIDHTSVTLTAGDGLTGGGDISANRTFAVNVDDSTIEINSDALRIKDAAITSAKIGAGGFVFNEAGAAVDFRVEGDTDIDLFLVDGSEDTVQIGKLNINGAFTLPTSDGSANQVLKTNGAGTVSWADDSTGGGGGGSMTTVKANGSQVGGADIVTLDFASNFSVAETPDTEINIDLSDTVSTKGITATTGLIVGVSGLHHQSGTIVHSTEAAWGEFPGNAQNSLNLLTGRTTDANFTSLEMNNGMYSGVKLPSNKTFFADVNIVGRRTNTGNEAAGRQHAAYQLKACLHNDAYGRAVVGSVTKTVIAESNSAWDVQLAFAGAGSGQTDFLLVQCKGAASSNVNWVAKVDLLEVGGLNETSAYREANILTNMSPELIP